MPSEHRHAAHSRPINSDQLSSALSARGSTRAFGAWRRTVMALRSVSDRSDLTFYKSLTMTKTLHSPVHLRNLLLAAGCATLLSADAQVLLDERFTGGASTTGFTVTSEDSDCDWIFAPAGLTPGAFNRDNGGSLPTGAGFDGDFAFLDSDECGPSDIIVNSTLVSPTFNAAGGNILSLSFSHQFQARVQSFCKVEVSNGSTWTEIVTYTGTNVGYPNPAASATFDITTAAAGSATAQIRFQFSSGWDWWWALDNIMVTASNCAFPTALAVSGVTPTSATIGFTPNASAGYEWVVTTGGLPGSGGDVATGTTSGGVASGLASGTSHTVYVRALCSGGGNSAWSPGVNFATPAVPPANDNCAGAIALTVNPDFLCGTVTAGTTAGATASAQPDVDTGLPNDDVWFSFVATNPVHRVSLVDVSGFTDMGHSTYRALPDPCAAAGMTLVLTSDPNLSNPTGLTVGETYYVRVYSWGDAATAATFNICIGTPPPPPANDNCAGAIALTVNPENVCTVVTAGTTAGATASPQPDVDSGTPSDDVWYSFVATNTAHRVSLLNVTGFTDMGHSTYRALPDPCAATGMTLVLTSDPDVSNLTGLTVGETYYVRVYSWADALNDASFDICISTPPPPPANNDCIGAVELTVNPNYGCAALTSGTTESATASPQPDVDSGTPNDDVWYSFVATATTHRVVLLNVSNFTDMGHSVYRALPDPCAATGMTLVLTSDPNESNPNTLTVGETYYVRVFSWSSTAIAATFDICIGTSPTIGIEEDLLYPALKVFPNPARDHVTFDVADLNVQRVRIIDAAGRVVMDAPFARTISIQALEAGTYTTLLFDRNATVIARSRFVKE